VTLGRLLPLFLLAAAPVAAQLPDSTPAQAGSEYQISVLTAGVGAEVWERWGHNMIRVRDTLTGEDVAYNWGMFSFEQEGFVRRFLMGRMRYWMAVDETARELRLYPYRDRTLIEQHLALTPAQRLALVAFLRWNAREENKYYRYDYYLDNCSTRLRDALDQALGGALRAQTGTRMAGTTFRRETRRLSAPDPLLYTGLMLGLGPATDRPITVWEEMFLPVRTMEELRHVTVPGPDGTPVALVTAEDTLYRSARYSEPVDAPRKLPLYLAIGGGLGLLLVVTGRLRRPRLFLALGALVALVLGLGGALLVFLMGFTDHAVTYGNENALLVSFLALILALALRPALDGSRKGGRLASASAVAVAGLALVALLLKVVLPAHQDTWETLTLLAPIDLGLALGTFYALSGPTWRPPKG
jgi:hypothetical protein